MAAAIYLMGTAVVAMGSGSSWSNNSGSGSSYIVYSRFVLRIKGVTVGKGATGLEDLTCSVGCAMMKGHMSVKGGMPSGGRCVAFHVRPAVVTHVPVVLRRIKG